MGKLLIVLLFLVGCGKTADFKQKLVRCAERPEPFYVELECGELQTLEIECGGVPQEIYIQRLCEGDNT